MKLGLVLEGGAMRGMYTAGVLDTFLEKNIEADCVVGVSAGALFGVNYLSGQKGRALRYSKRFNGDPNYLGLRPLLREGNLLDTQYAYYDVPHTLDPFDDESFRAARAPFYAVVTNVDTGEPEYIQIKSVFEQMDTLRASGSMPFVSHPVIVDGKRYLDGGIADSIPFLWMAAQGCDKLIVVLTREAEYRKKPMASAPLKLYAKKYPHIARELSRRHLVYNETVGLLREWEKAGRAFVLRPSRCVDIHRTEKDPQKLQELYDLGVQDTLARLDALQAYRAL